MSLRRRLALLTVVAFACGLLAIGGSSCPALVRNFLTDRLDSRSSRDDGVDHRPAWAASPGSSRREPRARTGS